MPGLEAKLARRRAEAEKKKSATDTADSASGLPAELSPVVSGLPSESLIGLMSDGDPAAIVIKVDDLVIRPQIREHFDEEALHGLAEDMREHGQDAPVLVRRLTDGRYELIDGERRVRAKAMLREREPSNIEHALIRASLKDISDDVRRLRQLAANIQHEALQPIEEARALAAIKDDLGLSDAELAGRINKSQSYVSRSLSLLRLSEPVQYLVESGAVGRRKAISQQDTILQDEIERLPADLKAQVDSGEISVVEAFKSRDEKSGGETEGRDGVNSAEPSPAKPKSEPRVAIPLRVATDLGELLMVLADRLDLAPVKITKQRGKPVRKELLTVLGQRTAEVLQTLKKRD